MKIEGSAVRRRRDPRQRDGCGKDRRLLQWDISALLWQTGRAAINIPQDLPSATS